MPVTDITRDRLTGVIIASAAGDALGSQYEFGPALPDAVTPEFGVGYFGHEAHEWTDDTSMAMPLLEAIAEGRDLADAHTLERVVAAWIEWARTSKDVGAHTRTVLAAVTLPVVESEVREVSQAVHDRAGRSGGNGALMRTGPLALAYLDGPDVALADTARRVSELTHWEQDSASACILWSLAIRHAIETGDLSFARGLAFVPDADRWRGLIDEAMRADAHPRDFNEGNGWVVRAFQGALAAISGADSLTDAVERAVRGGSDTDTVAAIAGSLAGALWGASDVPAEWSAKLHGWPGYTAEDLKRLVQEAI